LREQSLFALFFHFCYGIIGVTPEIRSRANGKAKEKQTVYDVSETVA
jgi:hypothetical protein